ncbi:MAG: helix-hairpin-helix domain-containing protein [candidate division WOR-3 bacterium]
MTRDEKCQWLFAISLILIVISIRLLLAQNANDLLEQDKSLPRSLLVQEIIEELTKNPLNLNTANLEDLLRIPYLTPILAYKIFEARKNKGNFKSVSELLNITGIDQELLAKIKPLIFIQQNPKPSKTSLTIQSKFVLDSLLNFKQLKQWAIDSRTTVLTDNFKMAILADKDINEARLTDFLSVAVAITNKNNKLIMGNYVLSFGSQLLFSGPYSYISSIKNFSLEPIKSMSELSGSYHHSSLFGLGFFQMISNFGIYAFISSSQLDADIKNGTVNRVYYYTNYADSTAQARRNQLRADLIGFRITNLLLNNAMLVGFTAYHNHYDKSFSPKDSSNSFVGSKLSLIGFDIQTKINNYLLRSEIGYSLNNGFGAAMQIIGDWRFFKININIYGQQKKFFSPYSKWRTLTNRHDKINGVFNIFYNLSGFRMYFLASTQQNFTTDSLPARIQYRIERTQAPFEFHLTLKSNYRETVLNTYGTHLDINYQLNKNYEFFCRIEDKYQKRTAELGWLICLGSKYHINNWRFESRFYYFNILSANCRIYAYEPILGSYSFSYHGYRIYGFGTTDILPKLMLVISFGYTNSFKTNWNLGIQINTKI